MSFYKLQDRLREEGWFVQWGMPCCQSCAWGDIPLEHEEGPFKNAPVDLDKVLMNHEQDCEVYGENEEDCSYCDGDGMIDNPDHDDEDPDSEPYVECDDCHGEGFILSEEDIADGKWFHTMYCMTPDKQDSSYFMFANNETGIENLNAILPIIEECGCTYHWNGSGDSRIEISWPI